MRTIMSLALCLAAWVTFAQKKDLVESRDEIVARAGRELDSAMRPPEGVLYLWKTENAITGEYAVDITIREKGDVVSVFMAGSEGADILMQNSVKDRIRLFEFNFKMPKGKTYKFRYVFNFNE